MRGCHAEGPFQSGHLGQVIVSPLEAQVSREVGVVLGRALGKSDGKGFRIAHMGHVNAPMILGTLGVVEMGLTALDIPHGKGGGGGGGGVSGEGGAGVKGREDAHRPIG